MRSVLAAMLMFLVVASGHALAEGFALRLGPSGYVAVPDADILDLTGDFTLETVICPDFDGMIAPQFQVPVIHKHQAHDNFDGSWFLGLRVGHPDTSDGTIVFEATPFFGNLFRSASPIPNLTPTHVAITYNDATKEYAVYLNGLLDSAGSADIGILNNARPVRFGLEAGGANQFAGSLDEIRFWNVVRSPEQVLSNFNRSLTGVEAGLVGYWNFESGDAFDFSGNGNNGVLFGDASITLDACRRPVRLIAIDIKPGSNTAGINLRSSGVIPVAVLSTDEFDARDVDSATVRFGPSEAVEAHGQGHLEDVNADGRVDLLVHFRTQETGLKCGQTSAALTARTLMGEQIEGSDAVSVFGCTR